MGESDLGLCTTSGFAKRMRLRSAIYRLKNVFGQKFWRLHSDDITQILPNWANSFLNSALRSRILFSRLQVPKLCTDLDRTLIYILILGTYSIPNSYGEMKCCLSVLAFCSYLPSARLLQICRVNVTFTVLPTNRFVSTTKNAMKCVVNWIPLRIRDTLKKP